MTNSQKIPWLRIGTESVAIVTSILLAFAIDAWWQNREENEVEVQYLLALHDDLTASLDLLDEREESQQRQIGYLESLLRADASIISSDDFQLWIRAGLFVLGTYEPQLSALRDLETSGQSRIIRDPPLRRTLASVSQRLDRFQAAQADFLLSQQLLLDPFLVDHFDLVNILGNGEAAASEMDSSVLEVSEFRSRVAFKLNQAGRVGSQYREIRDAFVEALGQIESRLEQLN